MTIKRSHDSLNSYIHFLFKLKLLETEEHLSRKLWIFTCVLANRSFKKNETFWLKVGINPIVPQSYFAFMSILDGFFLLKGNSTDFCLPNLHYLIILISNNLLFPFEEQRFNLRKSNFKKFLEKLLFIPYLFLLYLRKKRELHHFFKFFFIFKILLPIFRL